MIAKITLGTRGSELARAQTLLVQKAIRIVHPTVAIDTKIIVTRGDNAKLVDLNAGRKGLFTAESNERFSPGRWMPRFIVQRTYRVRPAWEHKSRQFFHGRQSMTC